MTPTTSLMFRDRPYDLALELARGKVNQVRNQYADWQGGGLAARRNGGPALGEARTCSGRPSWRPAVPGRPQADEALAIAHEARRVLVRRYQDQVFRLRHQRQPKLDTAPGLSDRAAPPRGSTTPSGCLQRGLRPLTWRATEPTESGYRWAEADAAVDWALYRNLRVFAGPLIDFARGPAGLRAQLQGDPLSFKSLMCDYVETVVDRYRGKVSRWLITAGANGSNALGIGEEDLIRLTAMAADAAWQIDPGLQLVFGLSRPVGRLPRRLGLRILPVRFRRHAVAPGLPFAGVEVEWLLGTSPRGSYCRDLLDASRTPRPVRPAGGPRAGIAGLPLGGGPDGQADAGAGPGRRGAIFSRQPGGLGGGVHQVGGVQVVRVRSILGPPVRCRPAPDPARGAGGCPRLAETGVRPAASDPGAH